MNEETGIPALVVSNNFVYPYFLNLLAITIVCFGLPFTLSATLFHRENTSCAPSHSAGNIQLSLLDSQSYPCPLTTPGLLIYYCVVWGSF
jgi:hypothetical protein